MKLFEFFKEKDKQLHMIICMLSAIIHPLLSIGLALGKEYGDKCCPSNKWDWRDIIADAIGLIIGTIIHVLL